MRIAMEKPQLEPSWGFSFPLTREGRSERPSGYALRHALPSDTVKPVDINLNLARPDGTPVEQADLPAKGTILVLAVNGYDDDDHDASYVGMHAAIIGWVPHAGDAERRLLRATCVTLNGNGA